MRGGWAGKNLLVSNHRNQSLEFSRLGRCLHPTGLMSFADSSLPRCGFSWAWGHSVRAGFGGLMSGVLGSSSLGEEAVCRHVVTQAKTSWVQEGEEMREPGENCTPKARMEETLQ